MLRKLKQAMMGRSEPTVATEQLLHRLGNLEKQVRELKKQTRLRSSLIRNSKQIATMSLADFKAVCRSACQTAYVGNETILCRVLGKRLLYADARDIGIASHLCMNGYWEAGITMAIARLVQPGWNCLDVGANHGYFTLLLADAVGKSGRVVAMEPNPRLVGMVQQSIAANGFDEWTTVTSKAASDRSADKIQLVIPPGHTGHASIGMVATEQDEVIEIETIAIDQLTETWSHVDFVKIDAEGAEEQIWYGMRQTIRKNPNIVILLEFGCVRYTNPKAFLEDIQAEGFKLRYLEVGAEVKDVTIEQCLTERLDSHWMLFLQR
jgi:FkbM family methyltransferase